MDLNFLWWAKPYPTGPFTVSDPQSQEISEFYVVQVRRETDFRAPKLWKGSSGTQMQKERIKTS